QSYKQSHRTRYACSKLTASHIWRRWSLNRFDQQRRLSTQLMDFGNVSQIQNLSVSGLNMKCNDVDGATVTLTSAEGGLESDDSEDYALTYDATFNPSGLAPFTLNAPGGPGLNDVSVSNSYGGSGALATGVAASIDIVTTETSPWAGGYSDTLTVNITSN
ncbi:hypothetical protein ACED34_18275, partial [Vibrio splendidus]|uniref:hypothetical protein n=1 Tax=Vibrio splendidus TaxID=29497 RepID=UPI00352C428D